MISFPFDNLSPEVLDRNIGSDVFAEYLKRIVGTNGIFAELGTKGIVTPSVGMAVSIHPCDGFIEGRLFAETSVVTKSLQDSNDLDRYDALVVRLNKSTRDIQYAVITGTPATYPQFPELVRQGDIYDILLSYTLVERLSTSIEARNITDTRLNSELCGVVPIFGSVDTTTIYNQIQADAADFKFETQADILRWFEDIKGQISEDAAVNLQLQIDAVNAALTNDVVLKNPTTSQAITLPSKSVSHTIQLYNSSNKIAEFESLFGTRLYRGVRVETGDLTTVGTSKIITAQPVTIQNNEVDVQKGVYTPVCYDSDGSAISNEHIEAKGSYYKIGKMVYTTAYVKFLTNTIQYRPGNVSVSLPFVAANTETTNNSGTNGTFLVTYKNLISNLGDQPQTVYGGAALWGGSNINFVYTAGTGTGGRQYHMSYAQVGANTGQISYTGMYECV